MFGSKFTVKWEPGRNGSPLHSPRLATTRDGKAGKVQKFKQKPQI
jgi:hypothetical protein